MSGRGRGGKFSKPKRGGGKHFSRNLRPLNADGEVESMWADRKENLDEDEDSDEDEDDEVTDESEAGDISTASPMNDANMTREQRKEVARARKAAAIAKQNRKTAEPGDLPSSEDDEGAEEEDNMPANPNHTVKAAKQASVAAEPSENVRRNIKRADDMSNLSRREREALQAQQAKERYAKLHAEGKTDEARADLARLKLVKEKREAEAARKKAEQEEREEYERSKRDQIEREERMRERAKSRKDRGGKGKKAGPV